MKILFTGASSFTGMWFVKELVKAGHEVTATFQKKLEDYSGLRLKRIQQIKCRKVFECSFGSETFLNLISQQSWNLFCHHAADVTNYKSLDFDFTSALAKNTYNLKAVLKALLEKNCNRVLLTGTVFEPNEGIGSSKAFSPYGLSKGLTSQVFQYYTETLNMKLDKFVIPNPFGPLEEPRFTQYLMKCWFQNKIASVSTPSYIRDNIPVSLLSLAYENFVSRNRGPAPFEKINPSGYRESQGDFANRFATQMRNRLNHACEVVLMEQKDFSEPLERVNNDILQLQWNEEQAWDDIANYYLEIKNEL